MRHRTFLENGSAIMADNNAPDITALTVQLVSAFVSNNTVASNDLAGLIQSTRTALTNELNPTPAAPEAPTYTPAVSVRKSLSSPEHILSLIDGKPYKTLKRHLAANGLTPEEYRSRYKLPKSYPLVATSYSDARRAVASKIGLGRKPVTPAAPAVEPKPAAAVAAAAPSAPAPAKAKAPAKPATPKKAVIGDAKAKPAKPAAPAATAAAKTAPKAPKATAALKTAPVAETKAAPAKAEPRKRLSIAGPKAEKPAAKAEAAAKPEVKAAAPKAKVAPKAKPAATPKTGKPAAAAKKPEKAAKAVVNGDATPKADSALASA